MVSPINFIVLSVEQPHQNIKSTLEGEGVGRAKGKEIILVCWIPTLTASAKKSCHCAKLVPFAHQDKGSIATQLSTQCPLSFSPFAVEQNLIRNRLKK